MNKHYIRIHISRTYPETIDLDKKVKIERGEKLGVVLSSRRFDTAGEKVVVELLLNNSEVRQLRGELNDICVFSERTADTPSRVSLRGKNEATKYFLIPKQLRKQLAIYGRVSCQRFENAGKMIFVYVIDPAGRKSSFLAA